MQNYVNYPASKMDIRTEHSSTSQYNIFSVPYTLCILELDFACYFCRLLLFVVHIYMCLSRGGGGGGGGVGVWIAWKIMHSSARQPNPLFYPREHLHAADAFSRRHIQTHFFVAGEGLVPCMFLSDERKQDEVIHI